MREDLVEISTSGAVLVLRMNEPAARNALSRRMLASLADAVRTADAGILAIVLTGSDGCFSAGGDFRELTGTRQDLDYDGAVSLLVAAILASDRILVAAIEGPCVGAAADIALACDYRVAGAESFIQIPAVHLGLLYNPESIQRLWRGFPPDTIRRLLLLGERFHDQAALQAGLFSQLVPRGESVDRAMQVLEKLGPQQADAVRATKRLLADLDRAPLDAVAWQKRRVELLDSEQRQLAVRQARARFASKAGTL